MKPNKQFSKSNLCERTQRKITTLNFSTIYFLHDDDPQQLLFEEETLETVEAFRRQEVNYACHDYCRVQRDSKRPFILEADRKLILQWSYNVVDYFNLSRESAAIAMNYSDRFLHSKHGPEYLKDTDKYQLLCIVSLYLAIKVHETASLTPMVFCEIGHGHYKESQMEEMEQIILRVLNWRVNPPTALDFVRLFLDLMPSGLDRGVRATSYMLARGQTERAVGDYKALTAKASQIAYSPIQNALEALGYSGIILSTTPLHCSDYEDLSDLRLRLCEAITFESSLMRVTPNASAGKASTKTKASDAETFREICLQESTTPRSVLSDTTSLKIVGR